MTSSPPGPAGSGVGDDVVWCGNGDHLEHGGRRVRAVARLEFPSGRFKPTTACVGDLNDMLRNAVFDEGIPILITPLEATP